MAYLTLTEEDYANKCRLFYCSEKTGGRFDRKKEKRYCRKCPDLDKCNKVTAQDYITLKKGIQSARRLAFRCEDIGGLCQLEKCDKYISFRKPCKIKYLEYKKAFSDGNKELLKKMSEGGLYGQ